jgi:hypothetical protein
LGVNESAAGEHLPHVPVAVVLVMSNPLLSFSLFSWRCFAKPYLSLLRSANGGEPRWNVLVPEMNALAQPKRAAVT